MNRRNIFALLASVFLSACEPVPAGKSSGYFNLPALLDAESARLAKEGHGLSKHITVDDRREEAAIREPDWSAELKPFYDCDISAPGMAGSYSVTGTDTAGGTVRYAALGKSMRVDTLTVDYRRQEPVRIKVIRITDNMYYRSRQELTFEPGMGFSIMSTQKMIFRPERTVAVHARFTAD